MSNSEIQTTEFFEQIPKTDYSTLLSVLEKRLPWSTQLYNTVKYSFVFDETEPFCFFFHKENPTLDDDSLIVGKGIMKTKAEDEGIMLTFLSPKTPESVTKAIANQLVETFSRGPCSYSNLTFVADRNTSPNVIQALLNKGYIIQIQSCDMVIQKNTLPTHEIDDNFILNNLDHTKYILKSLDPTADASVIGKYWTYGTWNDPTHFIQQCIRSYPSFGIYYRETGELVSWVLCYTFGSFGMLHTPEKWRGHGLGTIVMKLIVRELQKKGIYPITGVEPRNSVSRHLCVDKIGLVPHFPMDFIFTS